MADPPGMEAADRRARPLPLRLLAARRGIEGIRRVRRAVGCAAAGDVPGRQAGDRPLHGVARPRRPARPAGIPERGGGSGMSRDSLFDTISELVGCHSPSGNEAEIDRLLLERLERLGEPIVDGGGNIVLRRAGREPGPLRAVLAHKDEIGALVKRVEEGGRLAAVAVGDAHPWIWGEGPVDVIGRHRTVTGVLSFGARHVSKESPQRAQLDDSPVRWQDAWVETKLDAAALEQAGVTAGSRIVPARSRKHPVRLGAGGEYIASHALDDKASVAALLLLAERLESPRHDVDLVFTAREEIGCHGAQWYA